MLRDLLDDFRFALLVAATVVTVLLLVLFAVCFHDFMLFVANYG